MRTSREIRAEIEATERRRNELFLELREAERAEDKARCAAWLAEVCAMYPAPPGAQEWHSDYGRTVTDVRDVTAAGSYRLIQRRWSYYSFSFDPEVRHPMTVRPGTEDWYAWKRRRIAAGIEPAEESTP